VFTTQTAASWRPNQNGCKLVKELDTRPLGFGLGAPTAFGRASGGRQAARPTVCSRRRLAPAVEQLALLPTRGQWSLPPLTCARSPAKQLNGHESFNDRGYRIDSPL
jgi:hypothetical protein